LARQIEQWELMKPSFCEQLSTASEAMASVAEAYAANNPLAADSMAMKSIAADAAATACRVADPSVTEAVTKIEDRLEQALRDTDSTRIFEEQAALAVRLHEVPKIRSAATLGALSAAQLDNTRRIAEQAFRQVDWARLDQVLQDGLEIHQSAADLIGAYENLDVSGQIERFLELSLDTLPAWEVYGHSNLLRSLSYQGGAAPAPAEIEKEVGEQEVQEEIGETGRVSLLALLKARRPSLLHMWTGAREALDSANPDKVRQYCVSQRQLLLQLLREAAPDHVVREWTDAPEHFWNRNPDNQPTWKARLLFLCDQADRRDYGSFLVLDAGSALKIYDLLNKGVHKIEPNFSSHWIGHLRLRADNLLLFVLMLSVEARN
jgi:hypothetical protein